MNVPNSVCWNITKHCNDNCLFCYRDMNSGDLDFEKKKLVIEKVAQAGIRKLTFAGGEPLLVPKIRELIEYAKEKGLVVSMTTNGILLTQELCDFCVENLDWLTLSLDGPNDIIQDKMTRNENHFKNVLKILNYVLNSEKGKCRIKINTLISNINKDYILDIADIVTNNLVSRWKLFQFVSLRGSSKEYGNKFFISDDDFRKVVRETKKHIRGKDVILSISDRDNIEAGYFVVFPNGDIKISTKLQDTTLGNVLSDDFEMIWGNANYKHELHESRTNWILDK